MCDFGFDRDFCVHQCDEFMQELCGEVPCDNFLDDDFSVAPRHYQWECYNKSITENKGVFELFCGTGKSLIMALICRSCSLDNMCVLFPSIALVD